MLPRGEMEVPLRTLSRSSNTDTPVLTLSLDGEMICNGETTSARSSSSSGPGNRTRTLPGPFAAFIVAVRPDVDARVCGTMGGWGKLVDVTR